MFREKSEDKSEESLEVKRRRGRPTRAPKYRKIQCRIDEDIGSILVMYCKEKGVSESEAIRIAIRKLSEDL